MMTSNSSDPVVETAASTASVPETSTPTPSAEPKTGLEILRDQAKSFNEGKTEPAKVAAPVVLDPNAPVIPPAFQPNWKYKAFGKEKEIDSFWHPLVKDQDSEKKVKDLFTRADAFDDLKSKHDVTSKEFQEILSDHQALDKDVKRVMNFRNAKDYDNFFKSLRIPDQEIFDYVQQKLTLMENPQQRQMAEMQAQERQKNYELQEQNEFMQNQYQTQAVQARTMQLDMVLGRPDVERVANLFDQRSGQLGTFRDLVIEEAQKAYYSSGKDLSAEEATQMVLQRYGKLVEAGMQNTQSAPVVQASPQVQAKPIIPAAHGRGTSPIKKAPQSLDDLKQMQKELQAQGL